MAIQDKSEILTVGFYHGPTDLSVQLQSTCQSRSQFSVRRTHLQHYCDFLEVILNRKLTTACLWCL